jgi:hypothetical protein
MALPLTGRVIRKVLRILQAIDSHFSVMLSDGLWHKECQSIPFLLNLLLHPYNEIVEVHA